MEDLELNDIQGIVPRGYGSLGAASYLLLRITDTAPARSWLGKLVSTITTGEKSVADSALNIAFTFDGLRSLGLPDEALATFPEEFAEGMTTPYRQRLLGDFGASAPDRWVWGGPAVQPIDMLLMVFASDQSKLTSLCDALLTELSASGVTQVSKLDTFDLQGKEHFGFRDGISQPFIEGLPRANNAPRAQVVKAGEFILGYINEYGLYSDTPAVRSESDPDGMLPTVRDAKYRASAPMPGLKVEEERDLGRNGSYLVFRQLSQDVQGFIDFLNKAACDPLGTPDPDLAALISAKMVGRWPSGAPLVKWPTSDSPQLTLDNDFLYAKEDPFGFHCPIGSHIRRANPRDSLDPNPGSARSIAIGKRHMILRRGREYGRPLGDGGAGEERGLYFICVNANISRQFEFVQHTWLNNPKFDGLFDDTDPLIGTHLAGGSTFTIPFEPARRRIVNLPQFVTVRGGAYFFLPGLRALRYLASVGR